MSNPVCIYGLRSSCDREIRYIGQTSQRPKARLCDHINKAKNGLVKSRLSSWIISILDAGHKVEIFILEEGAERNTAEIRIIAEYRARGARLVNMTDGGEGGMGCARGPMSDEVKAKIAAKKRGGKLTDEHRAAIGAAMKNRFFSEEHRARIAQAKSGHVVSAATRKKLSDALKGRSRGW